MYKLKKICLIDSLFPMYIFDDIINGARQTWITHPRAIQSTQSKRKIRLPETDIPKLALVQK